MPILSFNVSYPSVILHICLLYVPVYVFYPINREQVRQVYFVYLLFLLVVCLFVWLLALLLPSLLLLVVLASFRAMSWDTFAQNQFSFKWRRNNVVTRIQRQQIRESNEWRHCLAAAAASTAAARVVVVQQIQNKQRNWRRSARFLHTYLLHFKQRTTLFESHPHRLFVRQPRRSV